VALEPAEPGQLPRQQGFTDLTDCVAADMQKMVKGLRLLTHSDPCVEAFQQQTGEWVILTAGELHLEVKNHYFCLLLVSLNVDFSGA